MNNYRKSKIFGKKEKFNLFLLVGIALTVIVIMYFSSKPTKVKESQRGFGKAELSQNDGKFQQELNINDNNNVIDNAIQVKEDINKKEESNIKNNQNNSKNDLAKIDNSKDVAVKSDNNKNTVVQNDKSKNDVAETSKSNEVVEKTNDKADTTKTNLNKEEVSTKDLAKNESNEAAQVSSPSNISFAIPVEGNVIRDFTTDTVFSKTLNTWRTREGIDFKAELGSKVVSVLDGVVEKIDNDLTERGQYIVIKHDDGFKTVYTNLDEEVKVVNGQKVRKGEVIATVGNTSGNYSNEDYGSHFNFVMYINNEEVNPSDYIKLK